MLVTLKDICEECKTVSIEGKEVIEPAYFSSMRAMITGAMEFVHYFLKMHQENFVYCGNNPADFQFDLSSGHMEYVGENGFVQVPENEFGVHSKEDTRVSISEFLAPELIEMILEKEDAELLFTVETDRYFMSVFLFEYFYHTGSPFEGKMMVNRCFLSPLEKEQYRLENGRFCMDEGEEENAPVKGIQDKLIRYWEVYPRKLGKMFQRAFLSGGTTLELRPTDIDWRQMFTYLMTDYKECGCGWHGFSNHLRENKNGTSACPTCGKLYYPFGDGLNTLLLAKDEKLYACQTGNNPFDTETVTGLVVENKKQKGLYGIKNISEDEWRGIYPDGSTRFINKGDVIPIWNNMMVNFVRGESWTLRLTQRLDRIEREWEREREKENE